MAQELSGNSGITQMKHIQGNSDTKTETKAGETTETLTVVKFIKTRRRV